MSLRFFCIPVFSPEPQAKVLNDFLLKHPHAMLDRQLIVDGQNSAWAVCCTIPDGGTSQCADSCHAASKAPKKRIDYREVLEPNHFIRYAKLRELRNGLAKEQGIPVYSIFTNAQLAEMAQLERLDRQSMAAIEGVGEKRVARYADIFFAALEEQ